MEFLYSIKQYCLEYTFVNQDKISVFPQKHKELFDYNWPNFINLSRLQILLAIIQLIYNLINVSSKNVISLIIEVGIALFYNIWDRYIISKLKCKLLLIALLITFHFSYILMDVSYFKNFNSLSIQEFESNLLLRITQGLLLMNLQPYFAFKLTFFIIQFCIVSIYIGYWNNQFYELIFILLVFISFYIHQEDQIRIIVNYKSIPSLIMNSLPQSVFMIKLQNFEIVAYNDKFLQQIRKSIQFIDQFSIYHIKDALTCFKLHSNQKFLDIEDADNIDLFEAIQIIKVKQYTNITQSNHKQDMTQNYQFIIDEKIFDIRFQCGVVYDNSQCIIISLSDITEIIQNTRISERTSLKSKLIQSLSHELRTRKNIIQGLLKFYLDQVEKNTELIRQAYNSCKIESNIISSIINYNLCIENQVVINENWYQVNKLLDKSIEQFNYEIEQKQITVNKLYQQNEIIHIKTDADLFEQIITNIISNSIKHCDKGNDSYITINIYKETRQRVQNKKNHFGYSKFLHKKSQSQSFQSFIDFSDTLQTILVIKIEDNGLGINQKKLQQIEETLQNDNFYQFTSKSDGFYLGLRSCNLLLQKLNQNQKIEIYINSKEGQGTDITLKFIIHDNNQSDNNIGIEDQIQSLKIIKKSWNQKEFICKCMQTILIVDDESFNNIILEKILNDLGYQVKKCSNGLDALQAYQQQAQKCQNKQCRLFHSIFMDYQMPIMNGVDATKAIIQESFKLNHPQVNIIGCTAFSAHDDIDELLKAGMKQVCIKPISKDAIKQVLSQFF